MTEKHNRWKKRRKKKIHEARQGGKMNGKKKIWQGILLLAECLVILGCFWFYKKEGRDFLLQASDFGTEGIYLKDFLDTGMEGCYIDSSYPETPEYARSGSIELPPGVFAITLHYAAEGGPQSYTLDGENIDFRLWLGNWHENLPSGRQSYTTQIWNDRVLENFSVVYDYSGDGYILAGDVEIVEQKKWVIGLAAFLLFFFLVLDVAIWKGEEIRRYFADRRHRMAWAGCIFIVFFASVPLLSPALYRGHDLEFHLLRIEGIKEGLQSGQFPVKIQPNWMNGYGYGASFFYGDVFLYIPALLRLCNWGVQSAYKMFVLITNGAACLLSYYAFRRFSKDYRAGLFGSFLYTCSTYRLTCIYIRAAVGEYTAMTFLPLFFLGIYEMLFVDEEENGVKGWALAALSYAGILYSHMITSEMTALFTVFTGLVFWRYTFKKDRLKRIWKCGLAVFICSLGFLVPFLDMSRDSYWFNMEKTGSGMQTYGVAFHQLFNLFPNGAGEALSYTTVERTQANMEMPYALGGGFLAAAVFFLFYWICYDGKGSRKIRLGKGLLLFSGIAVWMTSSSFPWNFLQAILGPFAFMVQNIQFPWRILGISTVALAFFACAAVDVFQNWDKYGIPAIIIVAVFATMSSGYLLGDRMTDNRAWYIQNEDSLDNFHYMGGEYMPENGEKAKKNDTSLKYPDAVEVSGVERHYHCFRISCANKGEEESYIDAPLLYYRGYAAEDMDTGKRMPVVKSGESKVRIKIPAGFAGDIYLEYRESWYWRMAEIMSVLGILGMSGGYLRKKWKGKMMKM